MRLRALHSPLDHKRNTGHCDIDAETENVKQDGYYALAQDHIEVGASDKVCINLRLCHSSYAEGQVGAAPGCPQYLLNLADLLCIVRQDQLPTAPEEVDADEDQDDAFEGPGAQHDRSFEGLGHEDV